MLKSARNSLLGISFLICCNESVPASAGILGEVGTINEQDEGGEKIIFIFI